MREKTRRGDRKKESKEGKKCRKRKQEEKMK